MNRDRSSFDSGQDIRDRTFEFACQIVDFCDATCKAGGIGRVIAPQLVRCGTSVASMMEEAKAAESKRDFISKCSIGLKEARESHVRLRIQERCRLGPPGQATALRIEANELVSIIATIVKNAKRNQPNAEF